MRSHFIAAIFISLGIMAVFVSDLSAADVPTVTQQAAVGPLSMTIAAQAVADKFNVYVGGGSDIEPPDTIGGGGGIPMISIGGGGSTFMAGELSSKGDKSKLIRIDCVINNGSDQEKSFKIGDITLKAASSQFGFAAVGYRGKICAMSEEDRKVVGAIAVTVSRNSSPRLSYIFPWTDLTATEAELVMQQNGATTAVKFHVTP